MRHACRRAPPAASRGAGGAGWAPSAASPHRLAVYFSVLPQHRLAYLGTAKHPFPDHLAFADGEEELSGRPISPGYIEFTRWAPGESDSEGDDDGYLDSPACTVVRRRGPLGGPHLRHLPAGSQAERAAHSPARRRQQMHAQPTVAAGRRSSGPAGGAAPLPALPAEDELHRPAGCQHLLGRAARVLAPPLLLRQLPRAVLHGLHGLALAACHSAGTLRWRRRGGLPRGDPLPPSARVAAVPLHAHNLSLLPCLLTCKVYSMSLVINQRGDAPPAAPAHAACAHTPEAFFGCSVTSPLVFGASAQARKFTKRVHKHGDPPAAGRRLLPQWGGGRPRGGGPKTSSERSKRRCAGGAGTPARCRRWAARAAWAGPLVPAAA